jgi:hypothetical protein
MPADSMNRLSGRRRLPPPQAFAFKSSAPASPPVHASGANRFAIEFYQKQAKLRCTDGQGLARPASERLFFHGRDLDDWLVAKAHVDSVISG